MDRIAWKLFIDAVELGSLSKVALLHGTSQPHVSRQIGSLERSYGARFFQRTGRGVVLTELGQRIAPQVRDWLTSTDQLENEIVKSSAKPLGRVRLGIIPSAAHPLMSTLLRQIALRYPLIQLRVREGQGSQLENWLEDGSIDIAILLRDGEATGRNALALAQTDTYLVAAKGDKLMKKASLPFSALNGLSLITFCHPSSWREQLDKVAREQGITLNVQIEADSVALQLAMVAEGGIYALLGSYAIASALQKGDIDAVRVVKPSIKRHICMALGRNGAVTLAMRTVMQEAQAVAKLLTT